MADEGLYCLESCPFPGAACLNDRLMWGIKAWVFLPIWVIPVLKLPVGLAKTCPVTSKVQILSVGSCLLYTLQYPAGQLPSKSWLHEKPSDDIAGSGLGICVPSEDLKTPNTWRPHFHTPVAGDAVPS